ncbi:MAG: GNAT family N-acetyltransferase [Dehalococcoidia bacterium]|nr:GNAT family N-acetyltransferase [Dehalococcoidia bacterium]
MHPSAESHHLPSTMYVRPFSWDDLPRWTVLYNTAFGLATTEGEFDEPEMRLHLSIPGLAPERDCFIARESGADAGLAVLWPELPIRRAVLQMGVSGGRSPQAVEQALLDAAIERASRLPVDLLHTQIPSEDDAGRRLLCDAGFLPVRQYATLRWSGDALPKEDLPHDFALRSFRIGHDTKALTDIQNAAFTDSWGFSPNTVEQIEARVASKSTTPEGILFVTHGDDVAAYNWTVRPAGPGGKLGRIAMTGVHPNYRGMGLSRPTVLAGMRWLASQGVEVIELEMDSSNLSAAKVYQSLGFEKVSDTVWYELRLGD